MKNLNIIVVGLGLIGGSICKALKKNTKHTICGFDLNKDIEEKALNDGAIDKAVSLNELQCADIVFICLFAKDSVKFVKDNIESFKKGGIITDVCGIKSYIADNIEALLKQKGIFYIGGHPMAGKEKSGFLNSEADMLKNASYILVKNKNTDEKSYNLISDIVSQMGCKIIKTDAKTHDRVIAYTSQLAHIVSSCYVKSPLIELESGFTGGSFQDMTRVALLDENLWKELFLLNSDNLLTEINTIIKNLTDYKMALQEKDEDKLANLLKEGKDIKNNHLK